MGDVIIRRGEIGDISGLADLGAEYHAENGVYSYVHADAQVYFKWVLETPGQFLAVAERDGKIIGALIASMNPLWYNFGKKRCFEEHWYVAPEHRRGLVGIKLWNFMEKWAAVNKVDLMMTGHLAQGFDAIKTAKMYKKMGFKETAVLYSRFKEQT